MLFRSLQFAIALSIYWCRRMVFMLYVLVHTYQCISSKCIPHDILQFFVSLAKLGKTSFYSCLCPFHWCSQLHTKTRRGEGNSSSEREFCTFPKSKLQTHTNVFPNIHTNSMLYMFVDFCVYLPFCLVVVKFLAAAIFALDIRGFKMCWTSAWNRQYTKQDKNQQQNQTDSVLTK